MTLTLYGVKNCDLMMKVRIWLESRSQAYGFHDYKAQGIDEDGFVFKRHGRWRPDPRTIFLSHQSF